MSESNRRGFRRNHTQLFLSLRRSPEPVINDRDDTSRAANFVIALADDVNVKLSLLDRRISEMDELFTKISLPTFDNRSTEQYNKEIEQITQEISRIINNLSSEIKRPIPSNDKEVASLIINLKQCHKLRLASLVQKFRALQVSKRPKLQEKSHHNADIISDMYADFNDDSMRDGGEIMIQQNVQNQENEELQELIRMMNDLNQLFRDMSLLIFEQGTLLDRIDTKIELAVQDVERGNEELLIANEHQSSNCFYVYIAVLVGLIGICIFIMIFRVL